MKYTPYLLIAPFFVLFGVFGLFPLLFNLVVSLRNWKLLDPELPGWAGLQNYRDMLSDPDMWNALYNTFGLFVFAAVPQLIIALFLAAILNRRLRLQTFFRMGILLPYITPIAASTLVFGAVFAPNSGIVNLLLKEVGVAPIEFRADVWTSWLAVVTMVNWRWTGYWAIIFLAAMQSIPKDLYEAATVDGAAAWTQFRRITLPLLRPSIIFAVVVSTIGGLQLFTEPLLFDDIPTNASGGSAHQFQTIAMYIYKVAWKDLDLGTAAAMSVGLVVMTILITSVNAWLSSRIGGHK
jgi:cellobiose transport system permease protein